MLQNTRGAVYMCMSSSELHTLYNAFTRAGGHWSTFIIWGKHAFTLGRADYQRQFEPILYGWREGEPHYWCGARDQGDLWLIDRPAVNDLHPTMKPVELVERAVLNSSRRGEIVLDPFAGSGSTLIACEKTARRARLVEIEPRYCDVIVRRWEEFTGKEAILESSGTSFTKTSSESAERESGLDENPLIDERGGPMATRGKRFQPGNQLGRGRPRGSRNKTSTRMQDLLNQYAEPVLKKAIGEALKGDRHIIRPLLDRILPVRRDVPIHLGTLPTRTAEDLSKASESVVQKVTSGKLTVSEAGAFLELLEKRRKTLETEEIEKRLRTLEARS
jgi:hypothetical protein